MTFEPSILVTAIAIILPLAIAITVAILARNITFFGRRTDNHHHVEVAARLNLLDWPSRMHAGSTGNAAMKVFPVYLLAICQRILRDRQGEFPLTVLCIAANFVSAVAIFVVAQGYWGTAVALTLTLLFATSFWPWLLALHGGPICVSQTCLLMSVLFLQHAPRYSPGAMAACCLAGGFFLGLCQFSSGSARKYIPLAVAAFLYGFWPARDPIASHPESLFNSYTVEIVSFTFLLLVSGVLLLHLIYKPILRSLYDGKGPAFLAEVFPTIPRREQPLAYFYGYVANVLRKVDRMAGMVLAYVLGVSYLFRSTTFYVSHLLLLAGFLAAVIWLTFPSMAKNMELFFRFANADKWAPHFPAYAKQLAELGQPIQAGMRGAGTKWIVLYFWRICPFFLLFFVAVFATANLLAMASLPAALIALAVSISPLMVAELTRAPQMGRSYFPAMAGLLVSMGYGTWTIDRELPDSTATGFWVLIAVFVLIGFVWNVRIFLDDVLPARLAPSDLGAFLARNNITEIATYDNAYNNAFVYSMKPDVLRRIQLHPITSLRDVTSRWIVVPGTSARAFNMESERLAIEHGDFQADPDLNRLIESRAIEGCAAASFKTFGTSRMWGHESEAVSYFDLILRRVGEADRYRGRAWVLEADKVRRALESKGGTSR